MLMIGMKESSLLFIFLLLFSCNDSNKVNKNVKNINGIEYTLIQKDKKGNYVLRIKNTTTSSGFIKSISESYEDYSEILHYYSYEMEHDIFTECEYGKNECMNYHFERIYDLSNFINITFSIDEKCADKLLINDNFFNTGTLKFTL